jgi:hypothetical protein
MEKETLEEAFDRIFDSIDYTEFDFTSFEQGAKWQQERMYSKEEVLELLLNRPGPYLSDEEIKEWFEQFKKK